MRTIWNKLVFVAVLAFAMGTMVGDASGGSFPIVQWRALDNNGDPVSGAYLCFFETATVIPFDTFSDEARTSANANPVVADANGLFGTVFMDPDQTYRVRYVTGGTLNDCDTGTQIWQQDGVNAGALASSNLATRIQQISSNPIDQGAVGNGVADEATEVQAAIDAADGSTYVVDLLGKVYRVDSQITLPSNVTLKNGTLDFSQAASPPVNSLAIEGSLGSALNLTVNGDSGDITVTVDSVSGVASGDYFFISTDDNWNANTDVGEIVQVESVAGLVITLTHALDHDFTTANNSTMQEMTTVTNVTIRNVDLTLNVSASVATVAVFVSVADRMHIENLSINGARSKGIEFRRVIDSRISNCKIENDATTGIAIDIWQASRNVVVDGCDIRRFHTGYRVGFDGNIDAGITKNVTVTNSRFAATENSATAYGFHVDSAAQYTAIGPNNTYTGRGTGAGTGIRAETWDTTIIDNRLIQAVDDGIHYLQDVTIADFGTEHARAVTIRGNYIESAGSEGIHAESTSVAIDDHPHSFLIIENHVYSSGGIGIRTSGSGGFEGLQVKNNTVLESTGDAIEVSHTILTGTYLVDGNEVDDVLEVTVADGHVINNRFRGTATARLISSGDGASISNNYFHDFADSSATAIDSTGANAIISNNRVECSSTVQIGISVAGTDPLVSGNTITECDTGILVLALGRSQVANNIVLSTTTAMTRGIFVDAGTVDGESFISGNMIERPTLVGIGVDTSVQLDALIVNGNYINLDAGAGVGDHTVRIEPNSADQVVISGNIFLRSEDGADNVNVDSTIVDVVFSGNFVFRGDFGFRGGIAGSSLTTGNIFRDVSQATPYVATTVGFAASTDSHNLDN